MWLEVTSVKHHQDSSFFVCIDVFDNKPCRFLIFTNLFCVCEFSRTIGAQSGTFSPQLTPPASSHPNNPEQTKSLPKVKGGGLQDDER